MPEIRVLDSDLINKIAAGEVVERPASVVKELAENALDAGATRITIEIADGGMGLIRVSDNGCGIPPEQAQVAFLRHATSKLRDFAGLSGIMTMGFRGEALSSIAAVSMLEMTTRTADNAVGTRVAVHGGVLQHEREAAANVGTTIAAEQLFYNTPARRKFLKKPGTEGSYVQDAVTRLALGHWNVGFTYINNGVEVFNTSGESLRSAALAIYGRDIAGKLLDVRHERGKIVVTGLAGKPELGRGNRAMGSFFINKRYIRNNIVQTAVETAYKIKLTTGKFPVYILNLEIPPELADVNVHPAKMEARFDRDVDIFRIMMGAVDEALRKTDIAQGAGLAAAVRQKPLIVRESYKPPDFLPDFTRKVRDTENDAIPMLSEAVARMPYTAESDKNIPDLSYIYLPKEEPDIPEKGIEVKPEFRVIGQFFGTYFLIELSDYSACYIMDQHAAHERILYEEIMERLKTSGVISQRVIEPIAIRITPAEAQIIEDNRQLLINMGFELEDMYDNNVALRSVPVIFDRPQDGGFFTEIVDKLAEDCAAPELYKQEVVSRMACCAAVKANDRLAPQEARALIERALKLDNPFTCPHGRPTMVEISRKEIEKMFKRIQ